MTVSSTTVKNSYSGNGSNDTFVYGFKIFADTDLEVIIRSALGVETIKTLTTHYTVTGAGSASGGNVVFESGAIPTATETVVIRREVPQTQAIDYIANDPFPAESHEEGLDRATMTIQQMQEELDRSFKVSSTNSITTPEFTDNAATRASKTLGFDSTGQVLTTVADFLPAGGDSALFQYSTTTADADPGAGFFRLDNATIASAAEMYIDDLEYNGTNVEAWVQSWDDVTGNDTNRGRIRITKAQSLDTWMVFKVTGAITNASGYTKVTLVYIDSAGTFVNNDKCWIAFTASGEDGAIPGYFYKFDTNTADSDPGAGELKFNNGTYASATAIYIDDDDANGVTTQADTATWGASDSVIKGYIHIVDINDSSTYARFKVGAAVTDASGYNKITVAHLTSNNTFSAADELSVTFVRNGDFGDAATIEVGTVGVSTVGAGGSATATVANGGSTSEASFNFAFGLPTGATGVTGASGTNSQLAMTWSNSTSDADPGAGKIAFNNATLGSVSILYVDDADDAGATISSFVQSWDDVSNGVARGIVTVTKEGTPATYALFKVTGAVTNASGYTKVPVTHVVSSGTFSNTNGVGVHFSYSGVDGVGDINGVTAGTGLSGGGTSGDVTLNVDLLSKTEGTNFTDSLLVGHTTHGTLSSAEDNTGVGIGALDNLSSGDRNTAVGSDSGTAISSGLDNTIIGAGAGASLTSTGKNTYIGSSAGSNSNAGDRNTAVGHNAGQNITSADGCVFIGSSMTADSASENRQLKIGGNDGSTTTTWISGDSSGNVSVPANLNLSGSNKELRFYEGANYVGFEAPALTADKIWVLPAADGSANQVLKTDGSGNLGFAAAAAGNANTPAFSAYASATQNGLTSGSYVKIVFGTELLDTDNTFATNRFTVPTGGAGTYHFSSNLVLQATNGVSELIQANGAFYKNGSIYAQIGRFDGRNAGYSRETSVNGQLTVTLAETDYIEVYGLVVTGSGTGEVNYGDKGARFSGYKLIT